MKAFLLALFLVGLSAVLLAALAVSSVKAESYACYEYSVALQGSFDWSKQGHTNQAQALASRGGYGLAVEGSSAYQLELARLYDSRSYAANLVAQGNDAYLAWLTADLEYGRWLHRWWAEYLTANPYDAANYTFDNASFQWWAVGLYDWRIATLNALAYTC